MIKTKIPQSIRQILDLFIRFNFTHFQYKIIADRLELKVDTLIQRISRNKEYFEIDDSQRPNRISVTKGIEELYFYRDKNRCHVCQKTIDPEILTLKFRNPSEYDKYNWNNVISVCDECKDKEIVKREKRVKKPGAYEYKEIFIKITSRRNPKTKDYENYYEFDELNGAGDFPLLDEEDNITSKTVADVLNYFSADGWEVVHIERIMEEEYALEEYQVFFKRKREER
ncbi:MAG: hypothetical protein V3V33_01750 [Candidatus Lokiarchaeia archaeon]